MTDRNETILESCLVLADRDWYKRGLLKKDDHPTWTLFCSPAYLVRLLRLKLSATNGRQYRVVQHALYGRV